MLVKLFILYIVIFTIAMIYFVKKEKEKEFEKDLKKELDYESKRFNILL